MILDMFAVYGRATPDHEIGPVIFVANTSVQAAEMANEHFASEHNIKPRCFETLRIVEVRQPSDGHPGRVYEAPGHVGELFHVNPDGTVRKIEEAVLPRTIHTDKDGDGYVFLRSSLFPEK